MATNWQSLFPQGRTMAQPEPEGGYKPITELLAKPFTSIAQSQRTQGQPEGQGTVLLGSGQSPFAPSLPAPQNQQAGDISLMRPQQVQDQTELGPMSMELPVVNQAGAAFMEGVTLPQAGVGTVLSPPPTPSDQFSEAGIPQQSFDPSFLSAPSQQAPTPTAQSTPQSGLAAFGGRTLSEYLTDPTVKGAGLMTDPQGRMIDPNVDRSEYEELSAARSAASGPNLTSIAGQPRPGVDVPSLAMQRERMAAGLDPVAGAPMGTDMSQQQQRDMLDRGFDPATGKKIDRELTFEQKLDQDKFDFDVAKFKFDEASKAEDAATAERKSQDSAKFAARDMLRQNQNVMRKAQRAGKNIGFSTTGATGALFGLIPGTGAFDQKSTVETLQADAAFSTLQQMRNASKTGGALGQVSERELDLLMGAVGNLKIGQSEEQFRNNLVEYINLRNDAMGNIYDAFEADYGTQAANEAFKVNSRQDLVPEGGTSTGGSGTQADAPSGRFLVEVASD